MKFERWDKTEEVTLPNCPFCGGDPTVKYIGNEHTRIRKIEVSCTKCRVKRTDATLRFDFRWLEDVAAKNWSQRPTEVSNETT